MNYRTITSSDELWCKVQNYAESCSWRAGKALANAMDNNVFQDWERVVVAIDNEKICGYCTVAKTDCIPNECEGCKWLNTFNLMCNKTYESLLNGCVCTKRFTD